MFDELKTVMLAIDDEICETMLNKITYTKAIMKEVFRMYPVSIGVGRILAKDAILSNYHVPAGVRNSPRSIIWQFFVPNSISRSWT